MEDELAKFREEWVNEVRKKTNHGRKSSQSDARLGDGPVADQPRIAPTALELYRDAVEAESLGSLDSALQLYRRAFKLDSNVDRAYHRAQATASAQETSSITSTARATVLPVVATELSSTTNNNLAALLATFSPDLLEFTAENEELGVPLEQIPLELIVLILRELARVKDVTSLERFGASSRKARVISVDSTIWREIVNLTYVPPQIQEDIPFDEVVEQYGADYRRMFIEHPRIRLDGVYIAVCHYVRPGLSENAWVNITHLITYHRYLRFFPNGTVLSLLTNDETPPTEVVHLLKPSLRMKGLYIGRWQLVGTAVLVESLIDPSTPVNRYSFEMTLTLRSRPVGRWNRLDISGYNSVHKETDEVQALPLKHERAFWFSKVRSYGV